MVRECQPDQAIPGPLALLAWPLLKHLTAPAVHIALRTRKAAKALLTHLAAVQDYLHSHLDVVQLGCRTCGLAGGQGGKRKPHLRDTR